MTKEEFHKIIIKSDFTCDGYELHLKYLFNNNNSKSLFTITGLDFTEMFIGRKDTSGIQIKHKND